MPRVTIKEGGFLTKGEKTFSCLATEPLLSTEDRISYKIASDVAKKYGIDLSFVDAGRGEDETKLMYGFKAPYENSTKKEAARNMLEKAAIEFEKRLDKLVELSKSK